MKPSCVSLLRVQKENLERNLAHALAKGDIVNAGRFRQSIAQIDAYLRSWGARLR